MSVSDNSQPWQPDPDKYDYARNSQKKRVRDHWLSLNWDRWVTYNTVLNNTWVDPWFENEVTGITNNPPTIDPSTSEYRLDGYQMLQNIYGVRCWLKYKGYNDYAMQGMITAFMQESTVSGGVWQDGYHPFATIVGGFDPTVGPLGTSIGVYNQYYPWYRYSQIVDAYTVTQTDPNGIPQSIRADAGTWIAAKKPGILFDYNPSTSQYTIRWDFNTINGYDGTGGAYGLVQWTPWGKIPQIADQVGLNAKRYWQLNLTLQLMIIERERYWSSHEPPAGQGYLGQWTGALAVNALFTIRGWECRYGQSISWDDYANDSWIRWVNNRIVQLETDHSFTLTDDEKEWCRRQLGISIWEHCFEQTSYIDSVWRSFYDKSNYVMEAIRYWDTLETNDDYIRDIPRPHDIPWPTFELDSYHYEIIMPFLKRRDKTNARRRTVLL